MPKNSSIALFAIALMCPTLGTAAITVSSYTHLSGPNGSYPDSGGVELTDGITFSKAWTRPSTTVTLADVVNLTGWLNRDPSISFQFANTETVRSFTIWAADSDDSAGVGVPSSVTIRTADNSFTRTFAITDPPGTGSTVPFTFSGFSVTASELIVSAERNFQWTMLSEVQFETIPEPTSLLLLSLATLTCFIRRR